MSKTLSEIIGSLTLQLSTDADQRLSALVVDVIDLLGDWDRHQFSAQASLDDLIADALVELSDCKDQTELFERICPVAARAFSSQSTFIARLGQGVWSAWRGYQIELGAGTLRWNDAKEIPLGKLPVELEAIQGGRAVALDARPRDGVDLPESFRRITESGPYIMAPICVGPNTLALLYLSQPSRSMVSPAEHIERTQRFASAASRILERELLYGRFRVQRKTMRASMGSMERIMSSLDTGVDLVRLTGRARADTVSTVGPPLNKLSSTWDEVLTTRERDVVGLLILGHGNAEIASQLVIAPNTVKSHARNIMKKLGVVNRTELIVRYHGAAEAPGRSRSRT